jgi:tripartite-type tricarboxylate transporter receptor subunit TctC
MINFWMLPAVTGALALGISLSVIAHAQSEYPTRPITIVSPVATGGTYSTYARIIGSKLEERLRQPIVVENRPGAGTVIGTNSVARAAPDGYTLLMAGSPALAISTTVNKSLPYDAAADFAPISLIGKSPQVLVVNATLPIKSVDDIARYAKDNLGKLNYASTGAGTVVHLQGELMKNQLGIDMTHVPYRGAAPALNDIAAGHVSMMFVSISPALPLIQAGKLRVIGISTKQRDEVWKDIPPLADVGLPGFDTSIWYMLVAPAKTPKPIVEKLHNEVSVIIQDATVRKQLLNQGVTPIGSPSLEALAKFIQSEIEDWGAIAKKAGVAGTL